MTTAAVVPAAVAVARYLSASMALVTLVAACGRSPPTRYYTLEAVAPAAALVATASSPVQLTAVHIPAVLDRPEVVTRVTANRLAIEDRDRWAAPLAEMMRRTLAQDLSARLPAGVFVFPDAPAPPNTRGLVLTVLDLTANADGALSMQTSWTLAAGHPARALITQQATLTAQASGGDAAAQAAALSRMLGELADRIAASVPKQ